MNKALILTSVVSLACSSFVRAQNGPPSGLPFGHTINPSYEKAVALLSGLLPPAGTAGKTNGSGERLTGVAKYRNTGAGMQGSDSNWYRYSGERTSRYDLLYLSYKTDYSYTTFRQDILVDYDTSFYRSLQFPSLPDVGYKQRDASGRVVRYAQNNSQLSDYTYDAQGNPGLLVVKYYSSQTASWVNNMRVGYEHDAQGHLISDTVSYWNTAANEWRPDETRQYTFSAAGLPVQVVVRTWNGLAFEPASRLQVSYTAANQFSTLKTEQWYGSGYLFKNRDSFAYTGGAVTYHLGQANVNGIVTVMEETRHINSNNLPDSIAMWFLDDPVAMTYDTTYIRLTWNSAGNPVTQSYRDAGDAVPDQLLRYYYTSFGGAQGVATVASPKSLRLFPNPAEDQLQVRCDFSGRYSLHIVNAAGQTVMNNSGNTAAGGCISLPLDNLASGCYWLQLRNAAGEQYGGTFLRK